MNANNQNIIKTFIRDDKTKQPHGIALIIRDGEDIRYGFSLVNSNLDKFKKERGTMIAIERAMAESFKLPVVPDRLEKVLKAFKHLESRAIKYFKDLDPEQIKIVEQDFDDDLTFGQFQEIL